MSCHVQFQVQEEGDNEIFLLFQKISSTSYT